MTGDIDAANLTSTRIALSVPLVNVYSHPLCASPVMASLPFDLQDFSVAQADETQRTAHSGPPGVNVEVKLIGVDDAAVENGADPKGALLVRGPPVGKMVGLEDYVDVHAGSGSEGDEAGHGEGWTPTGVGARVMSNGAFVILRAAKA